MIEKIKHKSGATIVIERVEKRGPGEDLESFEWMVEGVPTLAGLRKPAWSKSQAIALAKKAILDAVP